MDRQERRVARARRGLIAYMLMQTVTSLLMYAGFGLINPNPKVRLVVFAALAAWTVSFNVVMTVIGWRKAPKVVRPPPMPLSLNRL